uniref:Transposase n=1 Tax=Heterorhabditis bacteriophora TaxID=37862 RepID=A0A1I7XR40_HETBA
MVSDYANQSFAATVIRSIVIDITKV